MATCIGAKITRPTLGRRWGQHVYRDFGALENGFSLTSGQLNAVQGVFRGMVNEPMLASRNEDLLKTLMLLQGFFPEKVNQLHGGTDPAGVIRKIDGARTLANPNSLTVGPIINQSDVAPIIAYSNSVWANSAFTRTHPIFMRMATEASVVAPYAAIGLAQLSGVRPTTSGVEGGRGLLPPPGGPGAQRLAEYRYYRGAGATPAEAKYLMEPYRGMGHHWVSRWLGYDRLGLPPSFMESRFNIMGRSVFGPGFNLSRGELYRRHALADPSFGGASLKEGMRPWRAVDYGIDTAPRPLRWWYATPDATKAAAGAGIGIGIGLGLGNWLDEE
jgi:hypothetical protein